jgi:fucose permease
VLVAIILLFLPLPAIFKGVALFLIGFGNGPTFPNLTYLTPINFGKENSQSIVATQMAACNLGILLLPPVFGFFADYISIKLFPAFIGALYLLMVIYTVLHLNRAEKARKGI